MNQSLIELAISARQNAYAPYSGYPVGAAILDAEGNVWTGCNVENVSFGLSICAERSAVCKMIGDGKREVRMIAIASRDGAVPCGMCLQTLLEFAPNPRAVEVLTVSESGQSNKNFLSDLMPHGFRSDELKRT